MLRVTVCVLITVHVMDVVAVILAVLVADSLGVSAADSDGFIE